MKNGFRDILRSDLALNSAKLLSANVLAQIVGLLVYPVLTRMYAPDDFGLLNLFISIGGVMAIIASAEYQYAVLLPGEQKRAVAVWQVGMLCVLCVTALVALTIPLAAPIASLFKAPALASWYWALPVYVLLIGTWSLLNYWLSRGKAFGAVGRFQMVQTLGNAGGKLAFGTAGMLRGGLILSALLGPLVGLLSCFRNIRQSWSELKVFDRQECRSAAREYRNFPIFSLPRAMVNNVSGNLGMWLLTPVFGLGPVGYFGMAVTLAFRPINVISNSLYQVLFQRTSECVQKKEHIRGMFRQWLQKTSLIAGVFFVALYFVLPVLCRWLLGEGWEETGRLIQLMLPWLFFSILVAPICFLSDVFQKQKIGLLFELLLVGVRAAGLVAGILLKDFHIAILAYSAGSALVIMSQLIWLMSLVRSYERTLE